MIEIISYRFQAFLVDFLKIQLNLMVEYHIFFGVKITVWKFHDFPISEMLREINFGESRSSKSAIFAFFEGLNFVKLVNFSLQKAQKFVKIKVQSL